MVALANKNKLYAHEYFLFVNYYLVACSRVCGIRLVH